MIDSLVVKDSFLRGVVSFLSKGGRKTPPLEDAMNTDLWRDLRTIPSVVSTVNSNVIALRAGLLDKNNCPDSECDCSTVPGWVGGRLSKQPQHYGVPVASAKIRDLTHFFCYGFSNAGHVSRYTNGKGSLGLSGPPCMGHVANCPLQPRNQGSYILPPLFRTSFAGYTGFIPKKSFIKVSGWLACNS